MVAVETKKSQVSCNEGNVKRFIDRVKNQLAKILQVIISFIFYPFYLPYPHQPWLTLNRLQFIPSMYRQICLDDETQHPTQTRVSL